MTCANKSLSEICGDPQGIPVGAGAAGGGGDGGDGFLMHINAELRNKEDVSF
jgi:hypothetical protein